MKKLKIGILGGGRGRSFMDGIAANRKDAEVAAVCDAYAPALEKARQKMGDKIVVYQDFDRFLEHDIDAVVIANYATEHAPCAIRALDSGRHVLSECLAVRSPAEAIALIEAVERNPKTVYSYAENYCYFRHVIEMRRIFRSGGIGELLYCQGAYIHDCNSIWRSITFGGRNEHWRVWAPSTFYCTHSMGPVMYATGARPARLSAYETPSVTGRRVGSSKGDGAVITMQLSNKAVCRIIPWGNWHGGNGYALYGSDGYIEQIPGGKVRLRGASGEKEYEPVFPFDKAFAALAKNAGHGGGDFYTVTLFIDKILGRERFPELETIDVYDAVDMTMTGILGHRSLLSGNAAMDVPDFRDKTVREKYRMDSWAFGPASTPLFAPPVERIELDGALCEIFDEQGSRKAVFSSSGKETLIKTGLKKSEALVEVGPGSASAASFKVGSEAVPFVKLNAAGLIDQELFIKKIKAGFKAGE